MTSEFVSVRIRSESIPSSGVLFRQISSFHIELWQFIGSYFRDIGHVWMEVLVLVCSKLTPKLTLWSQTHV
jgi:hypothetical protein